MGQILTIPICDTIFSRCLDCFGREVEYVSKLEQNLDTLLVQKQKLIEAKNDIMGRVRVAEQRHQIKRKEKVRGWFLRVEAVVAQVDRDISGRSQEIGTLCLGGYCSSYEFGKKVAKMLVTVTELMEEGNGFHEIADNVAEAPAVEIPFDSTVVGLKSKVDEVWRCMFEKEVGIIGIYGTGGVGKSTLLTSVNNNFVNVSHDFDSVMMVVVSKDHQIGKIQDNIGEKLGLSGESWDNKTIEDKATILFNTLKKKKFALLLDDIWEWIDLKNVGVPLPGKLGSKVVFTTRFQDICGELKAHKYLKVECLGPEDAWTLFRDNIQKGILDNHPSIPQLARCVANECGGLPLALVTIGRAMACKRTPEEWEYAVEVLRSSTSNFANMEKKVYPLLKFSYDALPSDTVRSCFLYCSLYADDYKFPKRCLIDNWIIEGFLEEYDGSNARNKGHYIIGVLLRACLLEEEEGLSGECVKMHDVVRDMALWIACEIEKESQSYLVYANAGLIEMPNMRNWKEAKRISLMRNGICSLSNSPACPCLLTLLVNYNKLESISDDFFRSMPSLRVLNLSYNNGLLKLPSGILELVWLQQLDLSWTAIQEFPQEMKALVNLKCLNLEYIEYIHIPRQLLPNFSRLDTLRMVWCCYWNKAAENSVLFGGRERLVEELVCLKQLTALTITLRSFNALQKLLSSHRLKSCTEILKLEDCNELSSLNVLSLAYMKHLQSLNVHRFFELEELEIEFLGTAQKIQEPGVFHSLTLVEVRACHKLRDLTVFVLVPNLRQFHLAFCPKMEEIVSAEKLVEVTAMTGNHLIPFAKLQNLSLGNFPNLKGICSNALPFPHLKKMTVRNCPKLKDLSLDPNIAKQQQVVHIYGEKEWWEELQWEDEATQYAFSITFHQL